MTTKTIFITNVGYSTFTVPSDFISLVSVEAIGAGGAGAGSSVGAAGGGGGGGGSYAKSISVSGLSPGSTAYCLVGSGNIALSPVFPTFTLSPGIPIELKHTWFNTSSNAKPSTSSTGVFAAAGNSSYYNSNTLTFSPGLGGGYWTPSIGTTTYFGGNNSITNVGWSGGGGAAGPGGNGGDTRLTTSGGGGGASLTHAGYPAIDANGGNGGAGYGGAIAGYDAFLSGSSGALNGSGGGGCAAGVNGLRNMYTSPGADGSYWTETGTNRPAGSGGGGGSCISGGGNWYNNHGGLYGGGAGGSPPLTGQNASEIQNPLTRGYVLALDKTSWYGGQGIIVFTYISATPTGTLHRLYSTGNLNTVSLLDETITSSNVQFSADSINGILDEVIYSDANNPQMKLGNNRTIYVKNIFDEIGL
jgi:hypothetical protein